MPPDDLRHRLAEAQASTSRLLAALARAGLDDAAARAPSLLPGWSRGHVLTHLARNADAMRRAADGARRDERVAMYPGGDEARNAHIASGAGRPAAELVADVTESAGRLEQTWSSLPAEAWDREVLARQGPLLLWRTVGMRRREVEIHWVDLDLGYTPGEWPASFAAPLLPALLDTERLTARLPAGIAVQITATDLGRSWSVGSGRPVAVRGPSWALVAWLAGRAAAARAELGDTPELAPWV